MPYPPWVESGQGSACATTMFAIRTDAIGRALGAMQRVPEAAGA